MHKKTRSIGLLLSLSFSVSAFAWGENGHRIVGEIAEKRLGVKAKKAIAEIVGTESLARASTWPDEIKSDPKQYAHTVPWHFIQIADGQRFEDVAHPPEGDIFTALVQVEGILLNAKATLSQKREALRFMVHFVGDLHQPLHVGNGTDRGGNWCSVSWMSKLSNLHAVWDSDMIDSLKLSFTEYSKFLESALSPQNEKQWAGGRYADWISESQSLRESVYPKLVVDEKEVPGRPFCRDSRLGPIEPSLVPKLGYEYGYRFRSLLDQRLTQGGIRLAFALNSVFEGKSLSK